MDILFKNYRYFFYSYFLISPIMFLGTYSFFAVFHLIINKYFIARGKWLFIVALYYTLVTDVTLLCEHRSDTYGVIWNPFQGVLEIVLYHNIHVLREMVSNIILFIPMGIIFIGVYKINKIKCIIQISFTISVIIEIFQIIFKRGYFETQDILCNIVGAILGFLMRLIVLHVRKTDIVSGLIDTFRKF